MNDSIIINKYLYREFGNTTLPVYLYVCGRVRSRENAFNNILDDLIPLFSPAIDINTIKTTIRNFLEIKKNDYLNGVLKIQSQYSSKNYI